MIFGLGLRVGIFNGSAPFAVTVIPAIFGAAVISIALALAFVPADFERRLDRWAGGSHERVAKIARALATVPASFAAGVRTAIKLVRERHWGVLGAVIWWASTSATLWASFHAFGGPGVRRSRSSSWPTSAGSSATCCPCRAASAASTAA